MFKRSLISLVTFGPALFVGILASQVVTPAAQVNANVNIPPVAGLCDAVDPRIVCMQNALGISSPVFSATGAGNGTLVYWSNNHRIPRVSFRNALKSCGLEMLKPGNFTSARVESIVKSVTPEYRKVHVQGACKQSKIKEYRRAGVKISPDLNCNQPYLGYDVSRVIHAGDHSLAGHPVHPGQMIHGISDGEKMYAIAICNAGQQPPSCTDNPSCGIEE